MQKVEDNLNDIWDICMGGWVLRRRGEKGGGRKFEEIQLKTSLIWKRKQKY